MAARQLLVAATLLVGSSACADTGRGGPVGAPASPASPSSSSSAAPPTPSASGPAGEPPASSSGPAPEAPPVAAPEPRRSFVTVPDLGLRDVPVLRYRGTPDDGPGTAIQDRGLMASPRGPGGGVGPGEVGNFIVTGHRTSQGAPLRDLPSLREGAEIRVRSGDQVLVYRVTATRRTSFRSPASLARQSAPVPGRPGVAPTRPMLTLSTCATPEDNAAGNFWRDEFHNPEHRIDKIAVLESVRAG